MNDKYFLKNKASEFSDHVINMNKREDRALQLHIRQITKEEKTSLRLLKREIKQLKQEHDINQEKALQTIKKQRQNKYEASMRHIIPDQKKDMDLLTVYNTSKYLSFFNLSSQLFSKTTNENLTKPAKQIRTRIVTTAQPRYQYQLSISPVCITTSSLFQPFCKGTEMTLFDTNSISSYDSELNISIATNDSNLQLESDKKNEASAKKMLNNFQKRFIKSAPIDHFYRKIDQSQPKKLTN